MSDAPRTTSPPPDPLTPKELRRLAAAATAAPWRDDGSMGGVVSADPETLERERTSRGEAHIRAYGGALVCESAEKRDRELIVYLRNNAERFAVLIEVAEAAQGVVDWMDRWADSTERITSDRWQAWRSLREAVARLEALEASAHEPS